MPKMKTKKSVAKRFKVTATGKIKFKRAFKRHILSKHSTKSKRHKRADAFVEQVDVRQLKRCMPYGL